APSARDAGATDGGKRGGRSFRGSKQYRRHERARCSGLHGVTSMVKLGSPAGCWVSHSRYSRTFPPCPINSTDATLPLARLCWDRFLLSYPKVQNFRPCSNGSVRSSRVTVSARESSGLSVVSRVARASLLRAISWGGTSYRLRRPPST